MNFLIDTAYAQGAAAQQSNPYGFLIMMGLFFVIFYFMLIRPQSKRAKEHKAMLAALAAGDEVVTAGGIVGKVSSVGDHFVDLEVGNGVTLKVQRMQITALMPKGTLKG
jgi:preprotein translocase subunit YajC